MKQGWIKLHRQIEENEFYFAENPEVVLPHPVEDLGLGQHATRVAHEEAQQLELGRGEGDELARPGSTSRLSSSITRSPTTSARFGLGSDGRRGAAARVTGRPPLRG